MCPLTYSCPTCPPRPLLPGMKSKHTADQAASKLRNAVYSKKGHFNKELAKQGLVMNATEVVSERFSDTA